MIKIFLSKKNNLTKKKTKKKNYSTLQQFFNF